jgi:hypothetical protein
VCREVDGGDRELIAQAARRVDAVLFALEANVGEEQVGPLLSCERECLLDRGTRAEHAIAKPREARFELHGHDGFVLQHEQQRRGVFDLAHHRASFGTRSR